MWSTSIQCGPYITQEIVFGPHYKLGYNMLQRTLLNEVSHEVVIKQMVKAKKHTGNTNFTLKYTVF